MIEKDCTAFFNFHLFICNLDLTVKLHKALLKKSFRNDNDKTLNSFPGLFGSNNCFHCGSNGIDKQLFAAG